MHDLILIFFSSASSARPVSDCIAISPDFVVGVDMSGGIFGIGNSKGLFCLIFSSFGFK
jgi:hypothetical protein